MRSRFPACIMPRVRVRRVNNSLTSIHLFHAMHAGSLNRMTFPSFIIPYSSGVVPMPRVVFNLRRCEILWSAREIASMALSAEQARHTENVLHIALRACEIPRSVSKTVNNFFHYGLHLRPKKKQHVQRR